MCTKFFLWTVKNDVAKLSSIRQLFALSERTALSNVSVELMRMSISMHISIFSSKSTEPPLENCSKCTTRRKKININIVNRQCYFGVIERELLKNELRMWKMSLDHLQFDLFHFFLFVLCYGSLSNDINKLCRLKFGALIHNKFHAYWWYDDARETCAQNIKHT